MKEPPLLRYTGPLTGERFHKLERQFTKMFLSPGYEQIQQLSKKLVESSVSSDIKVFALCWEALSVGYNEKYECAEELLRTAWEKASPIECENGLLLQAKILKQLAFMRSFQGNDDKALEYISGAKERLFIAAPSNETAQTLHTELRLKRHRLFSRPIISRCLLNCINQLRKSMSNSLNMQNTWKNMRILLSAVSLQ